MEYFVFLTFFSLPGGIVALFVVSLIRYLLAKNRNRTQPGTFSEKELRKRKLFAIVTGVITGVLVTVFAGILILLFMSIAYM